MHFLITGHTGFKGSWLAAELARRGHEVSGLALEPPVGGLFEAAGIAGLLNFDIRVDIRDADGTAEAVSRVQPDVVLHLAAQPLVRASYAQPRETMEVNVMGTYNVLDAIRRTESVRAAAIITTDKVYRNVGKREGYVESDPLGGHDPYSASKAMADILTQSWIASFGGPPTAIARAGNVIGGGDVSADRLLPDIVGSIRRGEVPVLRNPASVRPWQHVADCNAGYLALIDALLAGGGRGEWNFAPGADAFVDVGTVTSLALEAWGRDADWRLDTTAEQPHEAHLLALDASKARTHLGWRDRLTVADAVRWTIEWERGVVESTATPRELLDAQLSAFAALG